MSLSLKEILAAKKASAEAQVEAISIDEDCFSLTSSTSVTSEASLRVLLTLVHVSAHKANLLANDNEGLRILSAWLAPLSSYNLPYNDKIPKLLQSYTFWQLGAVTGIPPAKLWGEILSILVESSKEKT